MKTTDMYTTGELKNGLSGQQGFTLIEMVVVTSVFIVVLMITGDALKTVLQRGGTIKASEESNIEGVVGLEIMRRDIVQAGFGLFSEGTPNYPEAAGAPYNTYNDGSTTPGGSQAPRAIIADNNIAVAGVLNGTDYLVIKATSVGRSRTSQNWTYVTGDGTRKLWGRDDFTDNFDKLIFLERDSQNNVFKLKRISADNYGVGYTANGDFRDQDNYDVSDYTPAASNILYAYGVDRINTAAFTFRAPFNRADFYVDRDANTPASCAPAAGVLYKATLNHNDGNFTEIPILDCVADMQIVLGWDTSADGGSNVVDTWSNADGSTTIGAGAVGSFISDPAQIRKRLRMVMIYLIAQEGRRDPNFINTNNAFLIGDQILDPAGSLTKTIDLTAANFQNFRWKLYRIAIRPKNLY